MNKKRIKKSLKGVAIIGLAASVGFGAAGCKTGSCGPGSCGSKSGMKEKGSCGQGAPAMTSCAGGQKEASE